MYRVVEINKPYDSTFGEGKGWIFCSNEIHDYYNALIMAIDHENRTGLKTYVSII